jgi:ankyrin repeat protein
LAAVKNNSCYALVGHLLSAGADLNHQGISGRTALHTFFNTTTKALIEFHHDEIGELTQDAYGRNIAHYVSYSKSSSTTDLNWCCRNNSQALTAVDNAGKTPLHYACQRGNLDIIERLLNERDEALYQPDWKGRTLLHYATESSRSVETIEILIREGFHTDAKDHYGRTVLHHAALVGNIKAVVKLISLGADATLEVIDEDSRTPLQLAAWCGRNGVVDVLCTYSTSQQGVELLEEENVRREQKCEVAMARANLLSWSAGLLITAWMIWWFAFP